MQIRDAVPEDFPAILALNLAFERFLSPMDAPRLALLYGQAQYCRVMTIEDRVIAFLLAFREHTAYDSSNYAWFKRHFQNQTFFYIDRVVIAAECQGQRLGQIFYDDVFATAMAQGVPRVACEYDLLPPNPASERFHAKMGFLSVGAHTVPYGGKQVSMQVAQLTEKAPATR